jgi:hypothetical protein
MSFIENAQIRWRSERGFVATWAVFFCVVLCFLFGDDCDSRQPFDRQRRQKCVHLFRLNHEKSIGLAPVRRELGQELFGRHPR